jgi:hypothetical protein
MKRVIVWTLVVGLLGSGFLAYSSVVTFTNWPWTMSRDASGSSALGFEAGDSKLRVLERAIELQRAGAILAVEPLGLEPTTSGTRFRGVALSTADLAILAQTNHWRVGLPDDNAWLELEFTGDRLVGVSRTDYRGPTE